MKFIGIIPARYASTRFPGKPLALLGGKPVIQHVYEKVAAVLETAYVATDDERIYDVVKSFGGQVVMTPFVHGPRVSRQSFSVVVPTARASHPSAHAIPEE